MSKFNLPVLSGTSYSLTRKSGGYSYFWSPLSADPATVELKSGPGLDMDTDRVRRMAIGLIRAVARFLQQFLD